MKIPGYKLVKILATGGTATVYLAIQSSLSRKVAVKVLNKLDEHGQSQRFLSEGKVIASLNHRNIVTVHDVGKIKNYHYISMEYLRGGSLGDKISNGMEIEDIFRVMQDIGNCLHYVHRRGLVHRDIKPGNILFHKDGTPKLSDFGIAKKIDCERPEDTINSYALGSPYYASPELVLGKPLDSRTDLYGLGIVFYEMLTGKKPYVENTHVRTMVAHVNQPIPKLDKKFATYQPLLNKLIAKSPKDRFKSAREMIEYIDGLQQGEYNAQPNLINMSKWVSKVYKNSNAKQRVAAVTVAALIVSGLGFIQNNLNRAANDQSADTTTVSVDQFENELFTADSVHAASSIKQKAKKAQDKYELINDPLPHNALETRDLTDLPEVAESAALQRNQQYPADTDGDTHSHQEETTQQLLNAGELAISEFRLTNPKGNNAFEYFQQVLKIDKQNEQAHTGILRIANIYARLTRKEIDEENLELAHLFIERGLTIRPGHQGLTELEAELREKSSPPDTQISQPPQHHPVTFASLDQQLNHSEPVVKQNQSKSVPQNWKELWDFMVGPYTAEDTLDDEHREKIRIHLP